MLYLASRSPRRRELLARLGCRFELLDLEIPEHPGPGETPLAYVERVSREKAEAGLARLGAAAPGAVVLGADTEVVLDDRAFGKPRDAADAARMLRELSGRDHEVISSVCVVAEGRCEQTSTRTRVHFAKLEDAFIKTYAASGEPLGKAGAYAIQGLGAAFVTRVEGSYTGIVGLPLHETAGLLAGFGLGPLAPMGGG